MFLNPNAILDAYNIIIEAIAETKGDNEIIEPNDWSYVIESIGGSIENKIKEATIGPAQGFEEGHRVIFPYERTSDFRASVQDLSVHLRHLMNSADERARLGTNGRQRVIEKFDYRVVAADFIKVLGRKLNIS